ncbi:MAG: putative quinol monooxygenase [Gemmatimonadaceae bacterium]
MRYSLFAKLTTRPEQRNAVVTLLLRDVEELRALGCDLYLVNISAAQPDAVWVTEVWSSKEAHQASLQLPAVKEAIAEAMPLLTGEFEGVELSVVGGLGLLVRPS